jgi:hypothetical protein
LNRHFGQGSALTAIRNKISLFGELIGMLAEDIVDATTVEVPDGPKLSGFALPYFFDENDALPAAPAP